MLRVLTDSDRARLGAVALKFGLPVTVFQVPDTDTALANLRALEETRKQSLRAARGRI